MLKVPVQPTTRLVSSCWRKPLCTTSVLTTVGMILVPAGCAAGQNQPGKALPTVTICDQRQIVPTLLNQRSRLASLLYWEEAGIQIASSNHRSFSSGRAGRSTIQRRADQLALLRGRRKRSHNARAGTYPRNDVQNRELRSAPCPVHPVPE